MSKNRINLISALKSYVGDKPLRTAEQIDDQTDRIFLNYMSEAKKKREEADPSFTKVKKFYQHSQPDNGPYAMICQRARLRFLRNKTSEVLQEEDLLQLRQVLSENISPPQDNKQRLNYNSFLTVASKLPLKFRHFFSPSVFMNFDRDNYGRIDMQSFFVFVVKKNSLFQTRVHLALYDKTGNGYLAQADLQEYIAELIPTFHHLKSMGEDYKEKYLIGAVSIFFLFLDPKRTGRIYIKDILMSELLDKLYQLKKVPVFQDDSSQNYFSIEFSINLYQRFCDLDRDKCGLLKKQDLSKYSLTLSSLVIDRIFEEYPTKGGRMDYKGFVEFALVMQNNQQPRTIHYFWRLLDVYHKGAIDSFVINMFARSVLQKLRAMGIDKTEYTVENIKDQVFDMAHPQQPMAITLNDLIKSKQTDVIIFMIVDAKILYDYSQRESGATLQVYNPY